MNRSITALLVRSATSHAATSAADSVRGAQVLQAQHSIECHALNGVGAGIGPDPGAIADRGFTPEHVVESRSRHVERDDRAQQSSERQWMSTAKSLMDARKL
jgi:mono/diheme cytochrome c family protein